MRVNFNLKDRKATESLVYVIIWNGGRRHKRSTGVSVRTDRWGGGKGRLTTDTEVEARLREIRLALEERINDLSTPTEIDAALDEVLAARPGHIPAKQNKAGRPSLWEFADEWASRNVSSSRQRKSNVAVMKDILGDWTDWEDIDSAAYLRLVNEMNKRGYSKNYQGTIISKLKAIMSEGFKLKYHKQDDYRYFTKMSEPADTVYLTKKEVERLWKADIKSPLTARARDLFIVGVFTAARFSDYSQLTKENIYRGKITFHQRKTGGKVIIPASPKVIEVLNRYGGKAPAMNQNTFNKEIKKACMMAKINERVQVQRSVGTRHYVEVVPKWQLVSSHTARRTGCTLLYLQGLPIRQIMLLSGHTTETSFLRYVRFTKEENAEILSDNEFFK